MITLIGMLARHAGHRLESLQRYQISPGKVYGAPHLYLTCRTCRLGLWDQDFSTHEGSEPQYPQFDYGWADDPDYGRYAFSWHRERDVAAIHGGGEYVEITVSGAWQPGQPLADVDMYETLNTRSGDTGQLMLDWDPVKLTEYFIASGQAG